MLPASWRLRSRRRGNVSKQNSRLRAIAARAPWAERAEQQVLGHRQLREQPAAFGHEGDPEIDDRLGRLADQFVPRAVDLGDDAAAAGRTMPITHFSSVLLPLPLVPSSATVSPAPTDSDTSCSTRTAP